MFLFVFFVSYYQCYQRQTTGHKATHNGHLFPDFVYSDALLDVLVGG